MVSVSIGHDWRPLSRTIRLHDLHRNHFRYTAILAKCWRDCLTLLGPRFALVAMWYVMSRSRSKSALPAWIAGVGLFRTISCGGWTYVTSTDDHNWHDIFMISYLVATLPWTLGCLALSPPHPVAIKWRKRFGGTFFAMLVPLVYFFIQHKVHRVSGGKDALGSDFSNSS